MLDRDTLARIYVDCQQVLYATEFPPPNPYPLPVGSLICFGPEVPMPHPYLSSILRCDADPSLKGISQDMYTIQAYLTHFTTPDGDDSDLVLLGKRPSGISPFFGWSEAVWEAAQDLGDRIKFQVTYHSTDPGNPAEKIARSDVPPALALGRTGPILESQQVFILKPTGEVIRNTIVSYTGNVDSVRPMFRGAIRVHSQLPDVLSILASSPAITDRDVRLMQSGISALSNRLTIDI